MEQMFKKILILGSGALKIGEAGEFDYSGSQAIKAAKEEGITTVLINPNIATVQTDPGFADIIYFLPVTPFYVEKIIEKEKPDGIMLSFGGQTALNCGLALEKSGVLEKHKVRVLGTPVETIRITEDRKAFNEELDKIGAKYAKSKTAKSEEEAKIIAKDIGYPVLVRAAFALGGLGSGFANNEEELLIILEKSFAYSEQVIIDESLLGWKELEYEVVRDSHDNCITVCNMENIDPMGIHTGESIVIAPSQTLTNYDYHLLRDIAIKTIRHLGIVGECNIQYAYNPQAREYRVIEVNARLSRSSALASKVTGYPLAYVAAKIGLGYALDEIKNSVTEKTTAFFEPSLDYVVCKIPRWDLEKFEKVDIKIGSEMKSVGEVMAIGRSIEEVLQKAIRNLDIGAVGLVGNEKDFDFKENDLDFATPRRMFAIVRAMIQGMSVEKIHEKTHIDYFFLEKIRNIVCTGTELRKKVKVGEDIGTEIELIKKAKKQGFSDLQIEKITKIPSSQIRKERIGLGVVPYFKKIDTLAGEFPARTNYLYATYHGMAHNKDFSVEQTNKKIIVLGSGAYRIGSSVEFDWCSVSTLKALKKLGYETIMINFNPETVSTDYDSSDSLYFEEISLERIQDIYECEKPMGIIISMGGQIANNLAMKLSEVGIPILGTEPLYIDMAEDRNKFSKLLDSIGVKQPIWAELTSLDASKRFGKEHGYPLIIRPSYVLSGANMRVCADEQQLEKFLKKATNLGSEHPVVISRFEEGAKEIEMDGVGQNGNLIIYAITEHVENAGVHSGDATVVLPAQKLYIETIRRIKKITKKIIKELHITGPFNIQFLAKDNNIKVIECNLRASRSFPFVSKTTGYNFIEIATKGMLGIDISGNYNTLDLDYVGVKASQFSFHRLKGADPKLGIEMSSTGEVACLGENIHQAYLSAVLSVGFKLPQKNILLSIGGIEEKVELFDSIKGLQKLGFVLFATSGTHKFLLHEGIHTNFVHKLSENKNENTLSYIQKRLVDFVINIPDSEEVRCEESDGYLMRRKATDIGISCMTDVKAVILFVEALQKLDMGKKLEIHSYGEFMKKNNSGL